MVEIQTLKIATVVAVLILVGMTILVHGEDPSGDILREFSANELMDMIQKGESPQFDHIIVKGDIELHKLNLQKKVTWTIRLNDSIFKGQVNLIGTCLDDPIDLSGSNFEKSILMDDTEFKGYVDFRGATFRDTVLFISAVFRENVDFRSATFESKSYFTNASFRGEADFRKAYFNENADFGKATFGEDANFGEASFLSAANFGSGLVFRDDIRRSNKTTTFNGDANFDEAIFNGHVDFERAVFSEIASFDEATFNEDADFTGASFSRVHGLIGYNPSFSQSTFNRNINFREVNFSRDVAFNGVSFNGNANFDRAYFDETASLIGTTFKGYLLGWEYIRSAFDCDEATYLGLIKNFKEHGQFIEADDCYYIYRYRYINSPWDFVSWISCGFGVRPQYAVYWSFIIIFIFGFSYWIGKGIYKISAIQEDATIKGRTWNLEVVRITLMVYTKYIFKYLNDLPSRITNLFHASRSVDISKISKKIWLKSFTTNLPLNDCLYFSALVFFTLHPPHGWEYSARWRYVVLFEDVLGGIFLTLFIVTLSNIMIRY